MQTSKFQYIFLALLIVAIIGGVFIFSRGRSGGITLSNITIWGTLPQVDFNTYAHTATTNNPNLSITYVQKNAATFDRDFVEALASGRGPDMVLLPINLLMRHKDKIYPIPYASLSQRTFKDTFIEEAELYMTSNGILAIPFTVDPLVMYWNRDLFTNASVTTPPKYWEDFYPLADKLSVKDSKLAISQSAVALGEYSNITHAKEIMAALFIQAGTPIVKLDPQDGRYKTYLTSSDGSFAASQSALTFFSQFANPVKPFYSWNRSLPASKDMFLAGDLATYFGYASEYNDLKQKNPNLNFDVTYLPQARNAPVKVTYGNLLGFAILKNSSVATDAFTTAYALTSKTNLEDWQTTSLLPPVRRDMLAEIPTTVTGPVFYNSALWSRAWLDPNPDETSSIFKTMIEDVNSGKSRVSDALQNANDRISNLIK